jgi:hypothetical protein
MLAVDSLPSKISYIIYSCWGRQQVGKLYKKAEGHGRPGHRPNADGGSRYRQGNRSLIPSLRSQISDHSEGSLTTCCA